jgi:hypothetical protein
MAGLLPFAGTVPTPSELVFLLLGVVVALLRWRLEYRLLSGEFSPWNLLDEYRDGKRSACDSNDE